MNIVDMYIFRLITDICNYGTVILYDYYVFHVKDV